MSASALEKHYRVKELAALWEFCDPTIIKMFADEPGVIRLESGSGRRRYVTLSIPESVVLRVHQRLAHDTPKADLPRRRPLRVIHLRDLRARMATAAIKRT